MLIPLLKYFQWVPIFFKVKARSIQWPKMFCAICFPPAVFPFYPHLALLSFWMTLLRHPGLLVLKCTRHAPTLVSLHWLGPLPGILLLQISLQLTSSLPSPLSSNVTFSVTAVLIPLLKTTSCPSPYLCQPPLTFLLFLLHQHLTPSNIYFVLHHLNENRHQSVCSLVPNN